MCECVCACEMLATFRSNPNSAGGFIPCVLKLTNGIQGQCPARVWADPIKQQSEVARGHEEEEGEKEEVKQKPSQVTTLMMERNRILRSLVGICPLLL